MFSRIIACVSESPARCYPFRDYKYHTTTNIHFTGVDKLRLLKIGRGITTRIKENVELCYSLTLCFQQSYAVIVNRIYEPILTCSLTLRVFSINLLTIDVLMTSKQTSPRDEREDILKERPVHSTIQ